ncbi:hypothetical protein AHF37_03304 [Paragonimus kellicotti]|nr:hypothetical protein AHF37_03304 [Paragonimus kellicotti]
MLRTGKVCYLKQADKLENLKKFQDPAYSLHAKFDANTFYLLTLAQMTASGLQGSRLYLILGLRIIWTSEEVAFVQNLVFYIEHAYRIPDYGIWERGDKTNHGLPELNTSSVGMAKAALEALSDLDLFGADGNPLSTIHTGGRPEDKDVPWLKSVETLMYGCRRFLRDGYRTAREDSSRLYYEPWELRLFEGIECEWPMFLAWLVLDATFREELDEADRYMSMLQDVVVRESVLSCDGPSAWEKPMCRRVSEVTNLSTINSLVLMPETYAVPADRIDAELANPHSQNRVTMGTLPHIWGQSLYILSNIIYEGLLLPGEIDPLGRRLLTEPKPDLSVQVVLVAEDEAMKSTLFDLQVDVQTFDEIYREAGIHIYPAKILGQLYRQLGVCEKLSLSGRTNKEVGILSTSQFYRLANQTVAFIPQFFDYQAFYLHLDVNFVLDCFRTCVAYLKRAWTRPGRPLLIFPVYHWFFRSADSKNPPSVLLSTMKKLATGYINGTRIFYVTAEDKILKLKLSYFSFITEEFFCISNIDNTYLSNLMISSFTVSLSNTFDKAYRGSHLLRQREESEDLTCSASKLALKRMLNPETNSREQNPNRPGSGVETQSQSSPSRTRPLPSPVEANILQNVSGSHTPSYNRSHRTSDAGGSGLPSSDWLNTLTPEQLVSRLTHTDNLAEQVELLGRLCQLQGLDWDTGIDPTQPANVRTLLKEVYERTSQATSWFLLRYTAGLLGKRAGSLARSLTDILVLQKQITVGLPPEPRELVIDAPLPPDQIAELIQKACGEDILMNVVTQEILIYLSMVARTKPQQLANILRLRIGLIIQMMGTELARTMCLSAEDSLYVLFSMSPFDMKRLLLNLLNGEEIRMVKTARNVRRKSTMISTKDTLKSYPSTNRRMSTNPRALSSHVPSLSGTLLNEEAREVHSTEMRNLWSRRRKIDGSLNRVPPGFYERVYTVLSRVQSLIIGGHVLCNSLTREMTTEEHKFALAVEHVSTMVATPEYRQLLIEATHVLGTLMMHDVTKRVNLGSAIKVEEIVEVANVLFLLDQVKYDANAMLCCAKILKEQNVTDVSTALSVRKPGPLICHGPHNVCQHFYDTPPAGRFGTMAYMVRGVSYLLQSFGPLRENGMLSVDCSVQ